MNSKKNNFLKVLSKEITDTIPLYCTGFPEQEFLKNYIEIYNLKSKNNDELILKEKDYSIIEQMGFDAISIWDFRVKRGGYPLDKYKRVDSWGRIYKNHWYQNDGVLKNKNDLETWEHLKTPSKEDLRILKNFLINSRYKLVPILSLPGLFEKTWQSMGLLYFSKCLRSNSAFIENAIEFFSEYLIGLVKSLQKSGAEIFLIADDCGYKTREFIPKEKWKALFFNKYKAIVNLIHKENNSVIIHSDGNINNLIKVFIDIGFDAIQSLEPSAGIDIYSLFKKYRNKQICFIGNVDISDLTYGTPEQIKKYVQNLIINARKYNFPLIISPTQQIQSHIKPKNIKAMIEATKTYLK